MSKNIDRIIRNSQNRIYFDEDEICYDVVFVINANSRGWILEKICKIVEKYSDLNCYFLYSERNDNLTYALPKARAYFFAHFSLAFWTMVRNPLVFGGSIFVYFTHFDKNKGITLAELSSFMNYCDHVFCMNSSHRRALISLGVDEESVTATIGGADPDMFRPHQRGRGKVGFVGAYYPRKQPEKILEIIRAMPDVQFQLVAPGPEHVDNEGLLWRNWSGFPALLACQNLTYIEAPYEDYPIHFDEMDVYVSLSAQEGGLYP
jgi:glycosyltransferase involved in cell wall biosynthesis